MKFRNKKQVLSLFHLFVLRNKGLVPTTKKCPNGGYCHCEPIQEFNITNRSAVITALRKAAASGNPGMGDSEFKAWKKELPEPLFARVEANNLNELEQKLICFTIECCLTEFTLYWSKKRPDGLWGLNLYDENELIPDQIIPKVQGFEAVADAIMTEVNSRRVLPEIVPHSLLLRFLERRQRLNQPVIHRKS